MGMKSRIIISNRKMFCTNPECSRTTFAETFPFIKRHTYGTVMIDIDTHRIIDLLPSREIEDVAQ